MSVGIYEIKNKINKKNYVGQSRNLRKRILRHFSDAKNESSSSYNYPLEKAIRKYGDKNFEIKILEKCSVQELNSREIYWIESKKSYLLGYNQTAGGDFAPVPQKIDKEMLKEITKELKNTEKKHQEIANKFGVSTEMIQGINTGRYWKRDIQYPIQKYQPIYNPKKNYCVDCGKKITIGAERCVECHQINSRKVERPSPMVLAKEIIDWGFSATARKYGVTDNAIKKWCIAYGMGKLKHEVAIWYSKQNGDLV